MTSLENEYYQKLRSAFENLKEACGKSEPTDSTGGTRKSGATEDLVVMGVVNAFRAIGYKPEEIASADTAAREQGPDIIGHRTDDQGNELWWIIEAKGLHPEQKTQSPDTDFTQGLGQLLKAMLNYGPKQRFKISYGIAVPHTYYYTQRCDQVASDAPMLRWHWFYVSSEGRLTLVKEPEGCKCLQQPLKKHGITVLSSNQSASEDAPGQSKAKGKR